MGRERLSKSVTCLKDEILCAPPNLEHMPEDERKVVVDILNTFNEGGYLVSEAIEILELCIEALKYIPVIKYRY